MMRKNTLGWIFLLMMLLLLQGCKNINMDAGESIVAPENRLIPITGTWKIEDCLGTERNASEKDETDRWIGKTAEFSKEYVMLGEEVCKNPEYKMKNVNAKNFFLYTYKINSKDLKIRDKDLQVISISSGNKHFYDFIKVEGKQLLVWIEDRFYSLKKISDQTNFLIVEDKKLKDTKLNIKKTKKESEHLLRSGVLLGLRSIECEEHKKNGKRSVSMKKVPYRTLWIATKNRRLYPVLQISDLFVPRKSGFWKVGINTLNRDGKMQDVLFAYPIEKNFKHEFSEIQRHEKENIRRNILFIGNDYIATEYGQSLAPDTQYYDRLQVLPIDNIQNEHSIKISDIAGEQGKYALMASGKERLASLEKHEFDKLEKKPKEESFGMVRRNGHWILQGRLNAKDPEHRESFIDFTINMIPSAKLINYDQLYVSWNAIKTKVPEALDAYTSPNNDLVIVVCQKAIYIYTLKGYQLSDKPLQKIKLQEKESVVMAEWATGDYVERWQEMIHSQASVVLKE
jgi:hypothetical protein